ncbi:MAG: ergothioneine biosynthesis protein EgtB [Pyrinomonadaceae bacterium]
MQGISTGKNSQKDLVEIYNQVRSRTQALCKPLEIEDYIPQPIEDVSPPKWNIAHTTWFFEEMILKKHLPGYTEFDEQYTFLFNSYYNSVGARTQRDHRGSLSRPTVEQVFNYRKHVDEHINLLLAGEVSDNVRELIVLGVNHEEQHQELFITDLKYIFSVNPLFPAYSGEVAPEEESESGGGGVIEIESGIHEIGYDGDAFCFDNELNRHKVYLGEFAIESRLVTNSEYIEFIDTGGYSDFRLWHSEGWDWVNDNEVRSPLYWYNGEDGWRHFTLGGLRNLPMDAPVCHVSYYEAAAFALWKGMRLPTEFEWEVASGKFEWGKRWEWTNSAYLPYPGFKTAAGAVGEYNGKFMINQMILRGSSMITPPGHSRYTYRNFFHPHLRWQFTGIRLAR